MGSRRVNEAGSGTAEVEVVVMLLKGHPISIPGEAANRIELSAIGGGFRKDASIGQRNLGVGWWSAAGAEQ